MEFQNDSGSQIFRRKNSLESEPRRYDLHLDFAREYLNPALHKGAIHMTKKLLFAAMLTAALSAGALSVHQLRTGTHAIVACGSPCTSGDICKRPCGCFFGLGGTTGVCQPEGPAPAPTK